MNRFTKLLALALLPTTLLANEQFVYRYKDGSWTVAYLTCEVNSTEEKTVTLVDFEYNDKDYPEFQMPNEVEQNGEKYIITEIGETAFKKETGDNSALKELTLPSTLSKIGNRAFEGMDVLETIILPNTLTEIGQYTFNKCSGLKSIVIPESVSFIDEGAFQNCKLLTELTIPENIETIPYIMCQYCYKLQKVYLGKNVKLIDDGAFGQCPEFSELYISSMTPPEAPHLITDVNFVTVYVPKGTEELYENQWTKAFKNAEYIGYYEEEHGEDGDGEISGIYTVDGTGLSVSVDGCNLTVNGIDGSLQIYSVSGYKVGEYQRESLTTSLPKGIYILKTESTVKKIII